MGTSKHVERPSALVRAEHGAAAARRNLDAGRKELLLPLRDERLLLAAARHVSDLNLSQSKTQDYVTGLLAEQGKPRRVRLTPRTFASRVKRLRVGLGGAATARRLQGLAMETAERRAVVVELEGLRDAINKILQAVRR